MPSADTMPLPPAGRKRVIDIDYQSLTRTELHKDKRCILVARRLPLIHVGSTE